MLVLKMEAVGKFTKWWYHNCRYFMDDETKEQRGEINCLKSHGWLEAGRDEGLLTPVPPCLQSAVGAN